MKDSHFRSIAKGITWRFVATSTTMTIVYLLTGDLALVATAGAFDVIIKIMIYYIHERAWGNIHWGRLGTQPVFETIKKDS